MQNIITSITGASVRLVSMGSNVTIKLEGTAAQVNHAMTLLYNYSAIGAIPEWYESSFTYMELSAAKRTFYRGLLTLCYVNSTAWSKALEHRRCVRAIMNTVRALRLMGIVVKSRLPNGYANA